MKELIVESIKIKGGNKGPAKVTEFDSPGQVNDPKYFDLKNLVDSTVRITFSYDEDGVIKNSEAVLEIGKKMTTMMVYYFIIDELKKLI